MEATSIKNKNIPKYLINWGINERLLYGLFYTLRGDYREMFLNVRAAEYLVTQIYEKIDVYDRVVNGRTCVYLEIHNNVYP